MNKDDILIRLKNEDIMKLLLRFSIPTTIALLIGSLYNIIDAIFVGRAVGTLGIGALAIVFPLQVIMLAFAQLVGIGAGSLLSRSYGSNEIDRVKKVTGNAILINLIITLTVMVLGLVFTDEILILLGATKAILPLSKEYLIIILLGSVFLTTGIVLSSLTRSEGNIKISVLAMVIGALLNIALDPLLIFVLKMNIRGAAYATIISQFITFIILVSYIFGGKSVLEVKIHHLKLKWIVIKEIIVIGLSSFVRLIIGSMIVIVINNLLKTYGGDIYISIYGSLTRIMTFLLMPILGLIQGLQPILGFNYGLKNRQRVLDTVVKSKKIALIIGIIVTIVVEVFAVQIMSMFSQNAEFIENGVVAIRIVFLVIPIVGLQMIASGIFQALGNAGYALFMALIRQVILIPFVFLLPRCMNLGIVGIWIAFPVSDFIATIITIILLKKSMKVITGDLK